MSNEQLLQAISDMMDQKLEEKLEEKLEQKLDQKLDEKLLPIYTQLDNVDRRLDDFYLEFKTFEKDITKSVHTLQDEMETVIMVLKLNDLVPQ